MTGAHGEQAAPVARWRLWAMAARPRTLTISLAPVLAASAQAYATTGRVNGPPTLAALMSALAIQIAANLFNDAADGARGHDGPARLGPRRVTASGLIAAGEVRRAAYMMAALAALAGSVAVAYGGWPILLIGALSLVAGWAYSNGPAPIAATPTGEVFVVVFFGLAAVVGVVYLADPAAVSAQTWCLGSALGLPAAATLTVNNHRDRAEDARNGRRTLAILIGEDGARRLYAALLFVAAALISSLTILAAGWIGALAGALTLAFAWRLAHRFAATPVGRGLNAMIAGTAGYELFLALLYAACALVGA